MNNNFTIQKKNIKMKIKRYDDVWLEQKKRTDECVYVRCFFLCNV